MTNTEAIAKVEAIRLSTIQKIKEGSADGYWDHLKPQVEALDIVLDLATKYHLLSK